MHLTSFVLLLVILSGTLNLGRLQGQEPKAAARVDHYGDPLPAGPRSPAWVRCGSGKSAPMPLRSRRAARCLFPQALFPACTLGCPDRPTFASTRR